MANYWTGLGAPRPCSPDMGCDAATASPCCRAIGRNTSKSNSRRQISASHACLNWRLSPRELSYCIELVSPALLIAEPDLAGILASTSAVGRPTIEIGPQYEQAMARQQRPGRFNSAAPEDGLVILYTSGTTGLPKGA